jgi:hypothetical protein
MISFVYEQHDFAGSSGGSSTRTILCLGGRVGSVLDSFSNRLSIIPVYIQIQINSGRLLKDVYFTLRQIIKNFIQTSI